MKTTEAFASYLKARTEEVGECMEWQQGRNSSGHPICSYAGKGGQLVRRLVAADAGINIEGKYLRMLCKNERCVRLEHMQATTVQTIMKHAGKDGRLSSLRKSIGCSIARRRTAKLDEAKVAEIRASAEPARVFAERYGVAVSTVWAARNGVHWKARTTSVFDWRPA